jgi:hypothetical protein
VIAMKKDARPSASQMDDERLVTEIRRLVGVVRFGPARRKHLEFLYGLLAQMAAYKEGRTHQMVRPNPKEPDIFSTFGRNAT